ncbi:MAG: hypothetical protein EBU23_15280, partial [Mycobacteriaceae bacterium]|nr:hypothetical protein [Mycobacteriaceae bacterium]
GCPRPWRCNGARVPFACRVALAPTTGWRSVYPLRICNWPWARARGPNPWRAPSAASTPTPLLMVVTTHDTTTPTDLALAAYERALQPKQLVLLPGDHFVPYQREFEKASSAALAWFVEHLGPVGA